MIMKKYWVILKKNSCAFFKSIIGKEKRTLDGLEETIRQLNAKLNTADENNKYLKAVKLEEENRRKEFASELNRVCNDLEQAKNIIVDLEGENGKLHSEILQLKQRAAAYKSLYKRKCKNDKGEKNEEGSAQS